jgi:hypothetical protein
VARIRVDTSSIRLINIILEDLKYNSENYNIFEEPEFKNIINLIYSTILDTIKG